MDTSGLALSIGVVSKYATDLVLYIVKLAKWSVPPVLIHALVLAVVVGVEFAAGKIYSVPIGIWSTVVTVLSAIGYDQFSGVLASSSDSKPPVVTPGATVVNR
jgi:hypothetical protein